MLAAHDFLVEIRAIRAFFLMNLLGGIFDHVVYVGLRAGAELSHDLILAKIFLSDHPLIEGLNPFSRHNLILGLIARCAYTKLRFVFCDSPGKPGRSLIKGLIYRLK